MKNQKKLILVMHFSVMLKLEKDDHLFCDDIKEINSVLKATKKKNTEIILKNYFKYPNVFPF